MQPNSWLIKTQNLQIASFEKAYQQTTDGLKNAPFSKVVQSASNLPFDAPADTKGAFWRGGIYLVADNIASPQDAREVIAHEMIGHYGLAGFFGNELPVVLDEIHENNPRACIAFIFKTNPIIEASGIKDG